MQTRIYPTCIQKFWLYLHSIFAVSCNSSTVLTWCWMLSTRNAASWMPAALHLAFDLPTLKWKNGFENWQLILRDQCYIHPHLLICRACHQSGYFLLVLEVEVSEFHDLYHIVNSCINWTLFYNCIMLFGVGASIYFKNTVENCGSRYWVGFSWFK